MINVWYSWVSEWGTLCSMLVPCQVLAYRDGEHVAWMLPPEFRRRRRGLTVDGPASTYHTTYRLGQHSARWPL